MGSDHDFSALSASGFSRTDSIHNPAASLVAHSNLHLEDDSSRTRDQSHSHLEFSQGTSSDNNSKNTLDAVNFSTSGNSSFRPGSASSSMLNSAQPFHMPQNMYDFHQQAFQQQLPNAGGAPDANTPQQQHFDSSNMNSYPMHNLAHFQQMENQKMAHMHLIGGRDGLPNTSQQNSNWNPQLAAGNYRMQGYGPPLMPATARHPSHLSAHSPAANSDMTLNAQWMNQQQQQQQGQANSVHMGFTPHVHLNPGEFYCELPGRNQDGDTLIVTKLSYLQTLMLSLTEVQNALSKYKEREMHMRGSHESVDSMSMADHSSIFGNLSGIPDHHNNLHAGAVQQNTHHDTGMNQQGELTQGGEELSNPQCDDDQVKRAD